jgi:hypothetical protein
VRCWLTSGLVALLCVACDAPLHGEGDPPPEASVGEDADVPDAYEPVTHDEAGAGTRPEAGLPVVKEAGATDAHAVDAGASDSGTQTDAADEPGDDGGDEGQGQGRGGDLRVEAP